MLSKQFLRNTVMYWGEQTSFYPLLPLPLAILLLSLVMTLSTSSILMEVMLHFHKQSRGKP